MGWAFREYLHKIGTGVNPNPPCSIGMDVAFLIDYTGSMGPVIDTVKASVADIVNAIDTEVGAGNYRLGLVISDEYDGAGTPTYNGSAGYIALPAAQKDVNSGVGHTQYNTAMELFQTNNETTFTTQLNLLNTGAFPLGQGAGAPEPLDIALDLVVNNDFLNSFRVNVAKYILIFTDAPPGGDDDVYDGIDDATIATLTNDCIDAGIKVFIIGAGANQTVWQNLATNTGGTFNTSFDSEVIISEIIASCQELEAPVSDAGVNQTIQIPTTTVNLDGSGSFDLDGTISTYLWEKISGGTATITSPNNVTTSVTGLEWGDYIFKLTVTDNDSLVDTDSMVVRVDPEASIQFTTDSVLASWQPTTVTNSGSILRWELTGGVVDSQTVNQPTFDLSSNGGTVTGYVGDSVDVTVLDINTLGLLTLDVSEVTGLLDLNASLNSLSTIDVSLNTALTDLNLESNSLISLSITTNTALVNLNCNNNTISTLDVSANTALVTLDCSDNSLTNLNITNNVGLTTLRCDGNFLVAGDIDNIIIQLDTNGLSNGALDIPTGRTSASDAAVTSLQGKGWTITEI